jgi:type IX secretion system PorP/SprF family membrane protein
MTMKAYILNIVMIVLAAGWMGSLHAQQLPQISQYQFNDYVINPAFAGTDDYFEVKGMNRYQWTGLTDAPRTFTLSMTAPFKNPHVAMGGYLFVDNVGPTSRTGMHVSYAYHLNLSETLKLGMSASLGVMQFAIDGTRIELATEGDPALYSELNSQILFDAKFGTVLYSDDFYVGITLPQLLQNRVDLYDSADPSMSRLEDHYMFTAGYRYAINDDITLEPSVLVKYVSPTPLKIDGSLRAIYQDMIWVGGSWRNNDAWVAMVGYEWNEALSIGYAFDFTTSNLQNHSDGTHEIMLGFRFDQ